MLYKEWCVRAYALTHQLQNYLLQIFSLDIAAINQFFLVVVNINADRGQQIGRHNLDAVVIGLGVIDINCLDPSEPDQPSWRSARQVRGCP